MPHFKDFGLQSYINNTQSCTSYYLRVTNSIIARTCTHKLLPMVLFVMNTSPKISEQVWPSKSIISFWSHQFGFLKYACKLGLQLWLHYKPDHRCMPSTFKPQSRTCGQHKLVHECWSKHSDSIKLGPHSIVNWVLLVQLSFLIPLSIIGSENLSNMHVRDYHSSSYYSCPIAVLLSSWQSQFICRVIISLHCPPITSLHVHVLLQ